MLLGFALRALPNLALRPRLIYSFALVITLRNQDQDASQLNSGEVLSILLCIMLQINGEQPDE